MTGEVKGHATSTSLVMEALAHVEAGAEIRFKISLSCAAACDLRGKPIRIVDDEDMAVIKETELTAFDGKSNETDELVLHAPAEAGDYTWIAVFPPADQEGVLHEESSAPVKFSVKAHSPVVKILDAPDPLAIDESFNIQVGVKCPAGCDLTGTLIEVIDHDDVIVAKGKLGDLAAPEKSDLSCTEISLSAPSVEGRYMWKARLQKPDLELAHEQTFATFAFGVTRRPEAVLTFEVTDSDSHAPVKGAQVVIRPRAYGGATFQGYTDAAGIVRIGVPKDEYHVYISKEVKEYFKPVIVVSGDMTINAELVTKSPDPF